ncbi:dihydrofolate reductase family protein [Spirosoma flavum]|uniref:Dihydrofolate reductase family protein n=1 Tax=Spirosoma flavum TaxID=2048557 RepID=A0ABW6AKI5_9BACT
MRKLKLQVQMTIDAYIGGTNGEMDWLTFDWDNELKNYATALTESVDCIILGRKLAEGFISYWASHPELEGADKINELKKVVFTKTLDQSKWDNTVLAQGELVEEITSLKQKNGKDLIVYGGGSFVSSLVKHGLIDEYHLFINPTAIGKGLPIFEELDGKQALLLVKSTAFACGIVVLHYELKRNA